MMTEQNEDKQPPSPSAIGWKETVEEQYRKIKENAETYPYVWASYILVYGGFALWTTYRWRVLRRTEDRVRVLQERLRKLVKAQESASSVSSVQKGQQSSVAASVEKGSSSGATTPPIK
ncbi:uncharacterized protein LOC115750520 [Rhodamnia argentea]|uniref:Uncharacterized protein LOC115750520 n=1 Tax=Rhodamnia argentea TaxID=178133 RepID=A0A8B8Q9K8_9MYRT|nr:uncharacterized protein LOC115750520 [Rhodamnia argentea]XP_048128792.1 uncharacterized protein LOC115750520 [Rhodamnia argentea]XP_048128793.1 uncharacterized protein LOC115750520 [Rhodamnia argentea]